MNLRSKYFLFTFFLLIFLSGCKTYIDSGNPISESSNLQELISLLEDIDPPDNYEVSFNHNYGKHVSVGHNVVARIQKEKIVFLNGSYTNSVGSGKPYADECDMIFDISSEDPANGSYSCRIIINYNEEWYNNKEIMEELNETMDEYLMQLNSQMYSTVAPYVTLSDLRNNALYMLTNHMRNHNITDDKVKKSENCYHWNYTYAGRSSFEVCFENRIITRFKMDSSSLGSNDNRHWQLIG